MCFLCAYAFVFCAWHCFQVYEAKLVQWERHRPRYHHLRPHNPHHQDLRRIWKEVGVPLELYMIQDLFSVAPWALEPDLVQLLSSFYRRNTINVCAQNRWSGRYRLRCSQLPRFSLSAAHSFTPCSARSETCLSIKLSMAKFGIIGVFFESDARQIGHVGLLRICR